MAGFTRTGFFGALLSALISVGCGSGDDGSGEPSWRAKASAELELIESAGSSVIPLKGALPYSLAGPVGCSDLSASWTLESTDASGLGIRFGALVRFDRVVVGLADAVGGETTPNMAAVLSEPTACAPAVVLSFDVEAGRANLVGSQWTLTSGAIDVKRAAYDPHVELEIDFNLRFVSPTTAGQELALRGLVGQTEAPGASIVAHPFASGPRCDQEREAETACEANNP